MILYFPPFYFLMQELYPLLPIQEQVAKIIHNLVKIYKFNLNDNFLYFYGKLNHKGSINLDNLITVTQLIQILSF